MVVRTGHVTILALLHALVGGGIVFAIVDSIAHLALGDTTEIITGEFSLVTLVVVTAFFVRSVAAIVLVITAPGVENASAIAATELGGFARVLGAVAGVLIGLVSASAVAVSIASPESGDTLAIGTGELVSITSRDVSR